MKGCVDGKPYRLTPSPNRTFSCPTSRSVLKNYIYYYIGNSYIYIKLEPTNPTYVAVFMQVYVPVYREYFEFFRHESFKPLCAECLDGTFNLCVPYYSIGYTWVKISIIYPANNSIEPRLIKNNSCVQYSSHGRCTHARQRRTHVAHTHVKQGRSSIGI
jgi:hypothetical protein